MPFKNEPELYTVWKGMKRRCYSPTFKQFADYGGRGITVCDRWMSYSNFEADMLPRPPGTSIERIDVNLGYSPDNCRWATRREQQRNRRATIYLTIGGKKYMLAELADISGHKPDTIKERVERGLSYKQVVHKGKYTCSETKKARNTHCPKGHAYLPDNAYFTPEGWRVCKICHRAKTKRQALAKAGKTER